MSEFTKGEWKVTDEEVRGADIFYRIEVKDYGLIALVDATPESDEPKANARLIAAAPDLYEACQEGLAECERSKILGATEDLAGLLDRIKRIEQALAKAEGK